MKKIILLSWWFVVYAQGLPTVGPFETSEQCVKIREEWALWNTNFKDRLVSDCWEYKGKVETERDDHVK